MGEEAHDLVREAAAHHDAFPAAAVTKLERVADVFHEHLAKSFITQQTIWAEWEAGGNKIRSKKYEKAVVDATPEYEADKSKYGANSARSVAVQNMYSRFYTLFTFPNIIYLKVRDIAKNCAGSMGVQEKAGMDKALQRLTSVQNMLNKAAPGQ